jgi:hypothetical protein
VRGQDGTNVVLRFYGKAPEAEKQLATSETQANGDSSLRRIVIGTNLAETSLTLDGLAYVIDSGLICEEYYVADQGKTMVTVWHSQAGCRQRVGRVGRKEPGEAYRLYTRDELKRHPEYTTPQIARANTEGVVLDLARAGIPIEEIEPALMASPGHGELKRAEEQLRRYGAIDADNDVSPVGQELTSLQGDSILERKLLCEADRFGVLLEMAVFLAVASLDDVPAPPFAGQRRKWLSLWAPSVDVNYDDADGPEASDAPEPPAGVEAPAGPEPSEQVASTDPFWGNPYVLADALLKRRAVLEGCLDDLELYLRLWQGWSSQPGVEARLSWASAHGVSDSALQRVEEKLVGLDEKPGPLRSFWAMGQKGTMGRDVDFTRLDLVRYLLAAGRPDRIYERGHGSSFRARQAGNDMRSPLVHHESTWADGAGVGCRRFGGEVARQWCVAVPKPIGKDLLLRHVVWLSPEWMASPPPSLDTPPVAIARRFATESAHHPQAAVGQAPFLSGPAKAGLRWPMPAVPAPARLQTEQWRVLLGQWTAPAAPAGRATVAYRVHEPSWCSKRLLFAQLPQGPLVPLDPGPDGGSGPAVGLEVSVNLEVRGGLVWAKLASGVVKGAPPSAPAPGGGDGDHGKAAMATARSAAVPPVPTPAPSPDASPSAQRAALVPTNLIVDATVDRVVITAGGRGYVVRVTTAAYAGLLLSVRSPLPDDALKQEARVGRAVRVRAMGRGGGALVGWADDEPPVDLEQLWPIGRCLEAVFLQRVTDRPNLAVVRVAGFGSGSPGWWAQFSQGEPDRPGGRLEVKVTGWCSGQNGRHPYLRFVRWLN